MEPLAMLARRILFAIAWGLVIVATWEKLANFTGRTLKFLNGHAPSRLLELAGIALMFVIALYLHEIKQITRGPASSG